MFVEKLPIPMLPPKKQQEMESLLDSMTEDEINQTIANLYGLSAEEFNWLKTNR